MAHRDNNIPEWLVANQDGKALPELRGKEWDQIADLKYFVAGKEVGNDEFHAFLDKWWDEN